MSRLIRAGAAVLVLCGAAAAMAEVPSPIAPGHVAEPAGFHRGAMHGYTPDTVRGGTAIDALALAKLIDAQHPVLLDVAEKDRKPPTMSKDTPWLPTHRSIPGSVFLEGGGKGSTDAGYADAFKMRVAALTGGDMAKPIVTFCHPDCWGSYNAAKRLIELGYTHVLWFRDGTEGWQAEHETRTVKPDREWIAAVPADVTQ